MYRNPSSSKRMMSPCEYTPRSFTVRSTWPVTSLEPTIMVF
ncbi:hypothetical protein [Bifidobacterium longum]|nr:hypothetical protein [Bifidobacterium longum]